MSSQNNLGDRWDDLSQVYHRREDRNNREIFPVERRYLPKPGMKVLDLGCGTGIHMSGFVENGANVMGMDSNFQMCKLASRFSPVVAADVRALPYPDNSFDYIWSRVVLSCVPEWKQAFKESWRVLCDGGSFVVLLPNRWSFLTPFRSTLVKLDYYSEGFCCHFSRQEIMQKAFLPGAELEACFVVPKEAHSANKFFFIGTKLLYGLDRLVGQYVHHWGGDLCLVIKKEAR
jgi:SAM-dependent methyltransferase